MSEHDVNGKEVTRMKYRSIVSKIKAMAGAREDESQDALELVVENIAANLTDVSRRSFAAQLPEELQNAAQMVPTITHIDEDIIDQLMDLEDIDESRARAHIRAAWQAICELFEREEVDEIKSQLPERVSASFGLRAATATGDE